MRHLADQLHAGAMSLYWYMSGKEELLDLMVDEVRHPWFPAVAAERPPLGPNALRSTEFGLAALEGVGLGPDAVLGTLTTVSDYVLGFTLSEVAEQEAWRRVGLTEGQWRKLVAPYLRQVAESGDFPYFTRYVADGEDAMGDEERFIFGLECLLDGIAARAG